MCKKIFFNIIHIMFFVLMAMIAVATIVLDKNLDNLFPNTVKYANGAYYLIAAILILLFFMLRRYLKGERDIGIISYRVIMFIIPLLIVIGWQIPVAKWIYWYTNEGDFGSIMYAAIGFNNGESFAERAYFLQSPNNANLAIVLSWLYKFIPNWRYILLIGALLTNISV